MSVELNAVSKKYSRSLTRSLRYGFLDSIRAGLGDTDRSTLRNNEFWALRDITLKIRRGERLGVLGRNGAGKSTLMKLISGLLVADAGTVKVEGFIDQMIELTSGFHPLLTGRENARLQAKIKGLNQDEFDRELNRIIEFTELGEFIDSPVSFYSSGMKARLGFALSTIRKPDILIVDEALAVGDLNFRLKCYHFLGEYLSETSFIFVSHSLHQLRRFCTRGIVLHGGSLAYDGNIQGAIDAYEEMNSNSTSDDASASLNEERIQLFAFAEEVPISNNDRIQYGSAITIHLKLQELPAGCKLTIILDDATRSHVAEWNSARTEFDYTGGPEVVVELGEFHYNPGYYRVYAQATAADDYTLLCYTRPITIKVEGIMMGLAAGQPPSNWREEPAFSFERNE